MKNQQMKDADRLKEIDRLARKRDEYERLMGCCRNDEVEEELQSLCNSCMSNLAWQLLMDGQYEWSCKLYNLLPMEGFACIKSLGIGIALIEMGNYEEARTVIERELVDFPDNAALWVAKGNLHKHQLQFEDALQCIERALEIDADDTQIRLSQAMVLAEMKRHNEAIPLLELLAEEIPNEPVILTNLAYCLLNTGKLEMAADMFRNLIGNGCYEANIYNGLYCCYVEMDCPEAALETAIEAFQKAPDRDDTTYCNLACAYLESGRLEEGKTLVYEGLLKYPDDVGLRLLLQSIEEGGDTMSGDISIDTCADMSSTKEGGEKWN